MSQYPGLAPGEPVPQFLDIHAPLTRPITTLQVTNFVLREGMVPALTTPDGSLYFGPVVEDGYYRIPSDCGIILFHQDEAVLPNFALPNAPSIDVAGNGGFTSYFFGRGVPQNTVGSHSSGDGAGKQSAAAAFTSLCRRYQQYDRYGGEWANGVFHGDGVLVTSDFTYTGKWTEGEMDGKGMILYTRKYVDARPAAGGHPAAAAGGGVGTFLLKGLSYVSPFELVTSAPAPKEYIGDFVAGHGRHGKGLMRYYNGDLYEGDWRDNCRHGKGKLRRADGELYDGDWANDGRAGYGKIMYPSGSLFKGTMHGDARHGEGVMRFANGDEYFGNFSGDRIEGQGTMRYRNGDIYEGAWHDQLRHGQGKYTLKRTGATMNGIFLHGLIHGEGIVIVPGVSTFVGTFVRGERTVGTMHWHDGVAAVAQAEARRGSELEDTLTSSTDNHSPLPPAGNFESTAFSSATSATTAKSATVKDCICYQGEWHGEHMQGKGLLWYVNGNFYAGSFHRSQRHGAGNMRYAAEKAEFSGHFTHGVRHGLGVLQRADGSIRAGRWRQDAFAEGYEGEWDGTAFHGVGRLTMPVNTFFGLRAANSSLKLTDIAAILNEAANKSGPEEDAKSAAEVVRTTNPVSAMTAASAGAVSDVLSRVELPAYFIDFRGVFRHGLRDGPGMLKLPALDGIIGGSLNLAEELKGGGKRSGTSASAGAGASKKGQRGAPATATVIPDKESNTSMVIKGRWVREVLHCEKAVLAFPCGAVYVGGFRNGARDAPRARLWWPDGSVLESRWSNDAPSGDGVWYERNRLDPVYQTIAPSVLRDSQSHRARDAAVPKSPNATADAVRSPRNSTSNSVDLLGLSYLWGLVGLNFASTADGDGRTEEDEVEDEWQHKPRRILIDFQDHYAAACTWYPHTMDLSTYTSRVLPQVVASTAPLGKDVPWPQVFHSQTMATALSSTGMWTSSGGGDARHASPNTPGTINAAMQSSPTVKQISACAASLHLAGPPSSLPIGRIGGTAVVYFASGAVLAGEWLANTPRLATPYRPWSAYDSFLTWQATRPAARLCEMLFPFQVAPRRQSCYSGILANAPDDVHGEPRRAMSETHAAMARMLSPLASATATTNNSVAASGVNSSGAEAASVAAIISSPDTRCTICGKEYSFFRKRVYCTVCLRSTCTSCLGQMDTESNARENIKALLRHAYLTAEETVQLTAVVATHGDAARRIAFPCLSMDRVDHALDGKGLASLPVCADCVRAMLWQLRHTQLWIPMSMFASVVDIEQHQRTMRHRGREVTESGSSGSVNSPLNGTPDAEAAPATPGLDYSRESSRVPASEDLPFSGPSSAVNRRQYTGPPHGSAVDGADRDVSTQEDSGQPSKQQRATDALNNRETAAESPPPHAPVDYTAPVSAAAPTAIRINAALLPPGQYIVYSGYTSHSIPHVYGELWWGRRYYYRGGFCAGERHGFGVQYMPNGERYEGAFQHDAWHGPGAYYLADGSVLLGEFRRGRVRVVYYHGEVEEDTVIGVRPHGRGIAYDGDGTIYNGEWVRGQRHGTGLLHLADGVSVYSGTFVANAMEGMGKLVTTSGAYYGDFSQGHQQGKGLLFTSNCVVEGSWVQGASNGFTRIFDRATGEVYETTYRDGNERDDCFAAPLMIEDAEAGDCGQCGAAFSFFLRRHHCRLCGDVFCDACTQQRAALPAHLSAASGDASSAAGSHNNNVSASTAAVVQRVCDACFYRLTQRRMVGLRRYKDGGVYAGCWSQGKWVSRGLYCRPDGLYIVMDAHGRPLLSIDLARVKMGSATSTATDATPPTGSGRTNGGGGGDSGEAAKAAPVQRASAGVPAGGLGVHRRLVRSMLPLSPSILQDAAPGKELLDYVQVVRESSSRKDLDAFLLWWTTTRSRCGLQVPLDIPLVSKYQRMPAQLLRGGKEATVTVGSDAATYLTSPARCTFAVPPTPSLTPIRLFVTLAESRRAMQAMVEGEVKERGTPLPTILPQDSQADANSTTTPPPACSVESSCLDASMSPALTPSRLTTEEKRTIDADVEAAAIRAARFMPVMIPRSPEVPITVATQPTAASGGVHVSQRRPSETPVSTKISPSSAHADADLYSGAAAFGLSTWVTRTPPAIEDDDISDEAVVAMMRTERQTWGSADAPPSGTAPLMPPTPAPPLQGQNATVPWEMWGTRDIPHYAPPPVTAIRDSLEDNARLTSSASSSSPSPSAPPPPKTEVDLYFACPLWTPDVPDAQMLLEQGKMAQAARLMDRLQQEHQRAETGNSAAGGNANDSSDEVPHDDGMEDGIEEAVFVSALSASAKTSAPAASKARSGSGNAAAAAAEAVARRSSWSAGNLHAAEHRAQSGWAPSPMHGPFTFTVSPFERRQSVDGQRWYSKVTQREVMDE